MENSQFFIFGKIWLETMYLNFLFLAKFGPRPCTIVQGLLPDFGVTLKIRKKSNFDRNQLKLETQLKYMYMYQEKI